MDVLPDSKLVPQTLRGMYGYRPAGVSDFYIKYDHCQHPAPAYDVASAGEYDGGVKATCENAVVEPAGKETCFAIPPLGKLNSKGQTADEAMEACKNRCSGARNMVRPQVAFDPMRFVGGTDMRGRCSALNLVPLNPPPDVAFPADQNIPWGVNDCTRSCFDNEPEGSFICYGLRETSTRTVEAPWEIIQDDPRDEAAAGGPNAHAPTSLLSQIALPILSLLSQIALPILSLLSQIALPILSLSQLGLPILSLSQLGLPILSLSQIALPILSLSQLALPQHSTSPACTCVTPALPSTPTEAIVRCATCSSPRALSAGLLFHVLPQGATQDVRWAALRGRLRPSASIRPVALWRPVHLL